MPAHAPLVRWLRGRSLEAPAWGLGEVDVSTSATKGRRIRLVLQLLRLALLRLQPTAVAPDHREARLGGGPE
eukprot:13513656-Alexandrium_andersonii.AAC.1